MSTLLNRFHSFFVNLAHDDENDPQETLIEYLQGFSLEGRVECLRYLMVEYGNGQLNTLHKFRYENDTFIWPPGIPDELQDGREVIDTTVGKVRAVFEGYVPKALDKAERQLIDISVGHNAPLQKAQEILASLEAKQNLSPSSMQQHEIEVQASEEIGEFMRIDEAAKYLKIEQTTLYKRTHLAFKIGDSNINYYLKKDLDAELAKGHAKRKQRNSTQATPPPDTKPSQPVRHNRKRKG